MPQWWAVVGSCAPSWAPRLSGPRRSQNTWIVQVLTASRASREAGLPADTMKDPVARGAVSLMPTAKPCFSPRTEIQSPRTLRRQRQTVRFLPAGVWRPCPSLVCRGWMTMMKLGGHRPRVMMFVHSCSTTIMAATLPRAWKLQVSIKFAFLLAQRSFQKTRGTIWASQSSRQPCLSIRAQDCARDRCWMLETRSSSIVLWLTLARPVSCL